MNDPVLLASGEVQITPAHVLSAAALWGILDPYSSMIRRRKARVALARERGIEADEGLLQRTSEQFRRDRGLRTAQSTAAWMKGWGVGLDAFTDFLEQQLLCDAVAADDGLPDSQGVDLGPAGIDHLWMSAVFGGEGEAWAHRLAARLAIAEEKGSASDVPASLFDPATVPGLSPDVLRQWITVLELPDGWYDQLIAYEAAHARFAESILTPSRLDAVMRARWSALFTMDFEMGSFRSEAAAREASLCVSEDGVEIAEVCAMAGGRFREGRVMLGDVPDGVRTRALSATAGALLPVFAWDDQFMVCRVRNKAEPSLEDETVREAVGRVVLEDAVRPLVRRHVRWAPGIVR